MKVYSTRDIARLLGMTEPQVRAQARAGFLRPERGARRAYRFSFQDLVLLKAARTLGQAGIPANRIRRSLGRLRRQFPPGRSLTDIRISAEDGKIVVRDGGSSWNPLSGQLQLEFRSPRPRRRPARRTPEPAQPSLLPRQDTAEGAVARGRQMYERDEVTGAIEQFRKALALRRTHPVAAFYLGVCFEDLGQVNEAIEAYRRAVENDPYNAEAHLSLAKLYERAGKKTASRRHLKSFRELTGHAREMKPAPRGRRP